MAVPGRGRFRPGMRRLMRNRRQMKAVAAGAVAKEAQEVVYGRLRDRGQAFSKHSKKTNPP